MVAPVDMIIAREGNRANEGKMEPLASVKEMGIQVPLIVYAEGDKFCLVDGHRRLFTARQLGLKEVPITIIRKEEAETAYAVANLDRQDLCPLDMYERAKDMQKAGRSPETIAATLKMSKYQLARYMKLDHLEADFMKELKAGKLSWEVASELASFPTDIQKSVKNNQWALANAKQCRKACNDASGISLERFSDSFLKWEMMCGDCLKCEFNRGADMTLFGESSKEEAVCTCPDKLAFKLNEFALDKNCEGIVIDSYRDEEWLKDNGIKPVTKDWASISDEKPNPEYKGQKKYMTAIGKVIWMGGSRVSSSSGYDEERNKLLISFGDNFKTFLRKISEEYREEAGQILSHINAIENKKVRSSIITKLSDLSYYTLRKEKATAEDHLCLIVMDSYTKIEDWSLSYWKKNEEVMADMKNTLKKWEPVAIKHPAAKKEWDAVIATSEKVTEKLEKKNG